MIIGVDIGGTKIAASSVAADGSLDRYHVISTVNDCSVLIESIARLVCEIAGDETVHAVGVGLAGFLNKDRSMVLSSPSLSSLAGVDFRSLLEDRLQVPVVLENDVNAAVWGEYVAGAGKGYSNVAMITSGTGVGGGAVLDGRLLVGEGSATEFGHLCVVFEGGRLCGCGRYGCLEAYASGGALKNSIELAFGSNVSTEGIGRLINAGSPAALAAVEEIGRWLAFGCVYVDRVLNPDVFIIGGGVSDIGDVLLGSIAASFLEAGGSLGSVQPEFKLAKLGNYAGVAGAGLLACEVGSA